MIRYGLISQVDYSKGRARVFFDEIGIVSDWLTLPKSKINDNRNFDINTQVACAMHENGEDGEILHEVPSDEQPPPSWADSDHEGVTFKDGTTVIYDNANKILTINAQSAELHFNCTKLIVSGDVIAGIDNISLTTHTHSSPVGVTGTPIPQP